MKKTVQCFLLLLSMVMLLPACLPAPERLTRKACRNAADEFVKQMVQTSRFEKIITPGVFFMGSDAAGMAMRNAMHNALIATPLDIVGMDEMEEKKKILDTLGQQLKYQEYYHAPTLVKMGEMMGQATIVTGRVVDFDRGLRSVRVGFQGQVLDLSKGAILYSGDVDGFWYEPLSMGEMGVDILIILFMILVMVWLSTRDLFFGNEPDAVKRRYLMRAVLVLATLAGFVFYYWVVG